MAAVDRIQELMDQAWLLSPEQVGNIEPGDELRLLSLLDEPFDNPLDRKTQFDVENPHIHLLKIIRNPEYFSFTCRKILNINLLPMQAVILKEMWYRPFPMFVATRGGGKSFLLALYSVLRCLLNQGTKVVVVGAAFRQAKVVFEYIETIWSNAPVLRDLCGNNKGRSNREQGPRRDIDRCECIIGDSIVTCLPLGDGSKIRGQRANVIISDEFASIPPAIYETVVAGFGSVSQDPIGNVQAEARKRLLQKLGKWQEEPEDKLAPIGNQSIISGTAYYSFNWFAKYFEKYRAIIESKGDMDRLASVLGEDSIDESINWRDYAIIRIPVDLMPPKFMDEKTVARSKMMVTSAIFLMEFKAVFPKDSEGFFKRSLIESCVAGSPTNDLGMKFHTALRGDPTVSHIMAIDPAAQSDNFAIVIIAIYPDHRRIVYCWTTKKKDHQARQKAGLTKEANFYYFAVRKIRQLMKSFKCERILLDSQGGGLSVQEALSDADKLETGEQPVWEVIDNDPANKKDSDNKKGLHILELVQFANANWTFAANHGLKKDMEDKTLLFPFMDSAILGLSIEDDKKESRIYDTLEDATMEIEALKDELAMIQHTQTATGRDKWDLPTVKGPSAGKGRMRKDRYSALLMANMGARQLARGARSPSHHVIGGWAQDLTKSVEKGPLYTLGEGWGEMNEEDAWGTVVNRGVTSQ